MYKISLYTLTCFK